MSKRLISVLLCFASAVGVVLSFPPYNQWLLVWVALVPFLCVIENKSLKASFQIGYGMGFLYFVGVLFWFYHLTEWFTVLAAIGVTLLFLYLSLYLAVFGVCVYMLRKRSPIVRVVLLPCAWVMLEFIRAHLFTGFNWASLGQSQVYNTFMIQIADTTGMYGVSFLVVMVNVAIKEWWVSRRKSEADTGMIPVISTVVLVLAVVFVYGYQHFYDFTFFVYGYKR
jgi:apolipoprotein N-acyltransferase